MMRSVLLLLSLLLLATQEVRPDAAIQCPDVKLKFPFELSQFLGVWYQIARFSRPVPTPPTAVQHLTQRPLLASCVRLTFTLRDDGKLRVERSGLDAQGKLRTQVGEAAQSQAELARLYFKYPGEYEEDLGVVEADYEDHAIFWGCHLSAEGHISQDSWILGREPTLDNTTMALLKGVLASKRVDIAQFVPTRQDELCLTQNPSNGTTVFDLNPEDVGV